MSDLANLIQIVDEPQGASRVRLITINRPEVRNALDSKAAKLLKSAILEADNDPRVRAVVITATGEKAFCAGADLRGIEKEEGSAVKDGVSAFGSVLETIRKVGVPVVAAVNGLAVGGGFGIMLACDLVILSEDAVVGTPEIRRGLFAMFISRFVFDMIPEKFANELLFTGKTLNASKAKAMYLANHVVKQNEVLNKALSVAGEIAQFSGSVLRKGKKSIYAQKDKSFDEAIDFLGNALKENLELNDAKEGVRSFLEKRKPVWTDS